MLETKDQVLKGEEANIEIKKCIKCDALTFGIIDEKYILWLETPTIRKSSLDLEAEEIYTLPSYLNDFNEARYWNNQLLCISDDSGALIRISPTC